MDISSVLQIIENKEHQEKFKDNSDKLAQQPDFSPQLSLDIEKAPTNKASKNAPISENEPISKILKGSENSRVDSPNQGFFKGIEQSTGFPLPVPMVEADPSKYAMPSNFTKTTLVGFEKTFIAKDVFNDKYNPNPTEQFDSSVLEVFSQEFPRVNATPNQEYLNLVRNEILKTRPSQSGSSIVGYRDDQGYVVEFNEDRPTAQGEGTYFTALAVVALSAGNYSQDEWEKANIETAILDLLEVLHTKSWGNPDSSGISHPIRHPSIFEYNREGKKVRNRPLTKDSFGPIIAACFYAFQCPNSTQSIKSKARNLLGKWTEYLAGHQWRLHSNYIDGEFDTEIIDGEEKLKNLFSNESGGRLSKLGREAFILVPHELAALRSCANALSVPSQTLSVWLNFSTELLLTITEVSAPAIGAAAGEALYEILGRLSYVQTYQIDLGVPDWNLDIVQADFRIDFPESLRRSISNSFSSACSVIIQESIRFGIPPNFLRLLEDALARILGDFPTVLRPSSWASVLADLLRQIIPWIESLDDSLIFSATLQLLKIDPKPDVVSYSLWTYAVEFECHPEVADIVRPVARDFLGYIRNRGNPNGLWAWLCGESSIVETQLQFFEANHPNQWWQYAYGPTPYNSWKVESLNENPLDYSRSSPRLDYLVLQGIYEKGVPSGLPKRVIDLNVYIEAIRSEISNIIAAAQKQFDTVGRYIQEFFDTEGNLVRYIWDKTGVFSHEVFKQGQRIYLTLKYITGTVERWNWDIVGSILDYSKWWRSEKDGSVLPEDIVEFLKRDITGQLERTRWDTKGIFTEYSKWWRSTADGGASGIDIIDNIIRNSDGSIIREIYNTSAVFQEAILWWRASANGATQAGDIILRYLRDASGKFERWEYTKAGEFFGYFQYWNSTARGSFSSNDLVFQKVRGLEGEISQYIWEKGKVLIQQTVYWRSTIGGEFSVEDMILKRLRDAQGVVQEWQWYQDKSFRSYQKWLKSTVDGFGLPDSLNWYRMREQSGVLIEIFYQIDGALQSYTKTWRSSPNGSFYWGDRSESWLRNVAGVLSRTFWSIDGAFTASEKYWRSLASGLTAAEDLIERVIRNGDGFLEQIQFEAGFVFVEAKRWWKSTITGVTLNEDLVYNTKRAADGLLVVFEFEIGGSLKRYTEFWKSATDGSALSQDRIQQIQRDASGSLSKWIWDRSGVFQKFTKWWRSTPLGDAVSSDVAILKIRYPNGSVEYSTYSTDGALVRLSTYWRSALDGLTQDADLTEALVRAAGGKLEIWNWNVEAVFEKYRVWGNSTTAGGAGLMDLQKIYQQLSNGNRLVRLYSQGVQISETLFNELGQVIGGISIPYPTWPPRLPG